MRHFSREWHILLIHYHNFPPLHIFLKNSRYKLEIYRKFALLFMTFLNASVTLLHLWSAQELASGGRSLWTQMTVFCSATWIRPLPTPLLSSQGPLEGCCSVGATTISQLSFSLPRKWLNCSKGLDVFFPGMETHGPDGYILNLEMHVPGLWEWASLWFELQSYFYTYFILNYAVGCLLPCSPSDWPGKLNA